MMFCRRKEQLLSGAVGQDSKPISSLGLWDCWGFCHWHNHKLSLRSVYETCVFGSTCLATFSVSEKNLFVTGLVGIMMALAVLFLLTFDFGGDVYSPQSVYNKKGVLVVAHFIWAACLLVLAAHLDPNRALSIALLTCLAVASFSELLVNNYNYPFDHDTIDRPVNKSLTMQSKWSILVSVIESIFYSEAETGPLDRISMAVVESGISNEAKKPKTSDTCYQARQKMFAKAAKGRVVSSMEENDKYVILEGYVFDVASFAAQHPGGTDLLLDYAKRHADITDQFAAFHNPVLYRRLLPLLVGELKIPKEKDTHIIDEAAADYRKLSEFLWANGYFDGAESDPESARICVYRHIGIFSLGVLAVFQVMVLQQCLQQQKEEFGLLPRYAQCAVAAITLGLFWQQVAFTAHDACHNGVVNRSKGGRPSTKIVPNNLLGWFHGSVLFGISSARWTDDHSVHHAITMRPCEDAQFKYLPIWCTSRKEFDSQQWHDMVKDFPPITIITKCLLCMQHWTLLPLAVVIGRFNFYIINIIYVIQHGIVYDLVGMGIFWLGYVSLMSLLSEDVWLQVCFTIVSHATIGILHVQLLVNHLATDAFTAEEEAALGYFRFQMRTTRNIDSNANWDWFHGGLQYQIEHHLFPQLPRHRLPLIKPALQELCARHGLQYESVPLMKSIQICLANFREIANEVWIGDLTIA